MATPKSKATAKAAPSVPAKQASRGGGDSSSDSDSSSSSSEEEKEEKMSKSPVKKKTQKAAGVVVFSKPAAAKKAKAESSSSSSDSSEEEEEEEKPKGKGTIRPQALKTNGTSALTTQNGKADKDSNEGEEEKKKAIVAVSKPGLYPKNLPPEFGPPNGVGYTLGGWGRERRLIIRFPVVCTECVGTWEEEQQTGLLSLAVL